MMMASYHCCSLALTSKRIWMPFFPYEIWESEGNGIKLNTSHIHRIPNKNWTTQKTLTQTPNINLCACKNMRRRMFEYIWKTKKRKLHTRTRDMKSQSGPKIGFNFRLNGKWHFSYVNNMKINNEPSVFFACVKSSKCYFHTPTIERLYQCLFNPIIDFENGEMENEQDFPCSWIITYISLNSN